MIIAKQNRTLKHKTLELITNVHSFNPETQNCRQCSDLLIHETFLHSTTNSFERSRRNNNPWIDEVKNELCQILSQRKQLVVIFEFDSPRHHGILEDAILEALINGKYFLPTCLRITFLIFRNSIPRR